MTQNNFHFTSILFDENLDSLFEYKKVFLLLNAAHLRSFDVFRTSIKTMTEERRECEQRLLTKLYDVHAAV